MAVDGNENEHYVRTTTGALSLLYIQLPSSKVLKKVRTFIEYTYSVRYSDMYRQLSTSMQ